MFAPIENKPELQVGIFGVGLLGGSVAMALKDRHMCACVHGYDPSPETLEAALALGVIDKAHTELGSWIAQLDLGVLAPPMGHLVELGTQVAKFAAPSSVWMDVGSVKQPVMQLQQLLPNFVPTHPMAGSERVGVTAATASLLENAVWVVCGQNQAAMRVQQLIKTLGAVPLELEPALHDRLVARISHVPYLLSVALNLMVAQDGYKEQLMFLAAGGFRDLTRVASGSPKMSTDMALTNKQAVKDALHDLRQVLLDIEHNLEQPPQLLQQGELAKHTRDALPIVKRSLLPETQDLVLQVPDRPGELAHITGALGAASINIKTIEVLSIRDSGGAIRLGFVTDAEKIAAKQLLELEGYVVHG